MCHTCTKNQMEEVERKHRNKQQKGKVFTGKMDLNLEFPKQASGTTYGVPIK